jgi:hypothetical protein
MMHLWVRAVSSYSWATLPSANATATDWCSVSATVDPASFVMCSVDATGAMATPTASTGSASSAWSRDSVLASVADLRQASIVACDNPACRAQHFLHVQVSPGSTLLTDSSTLLTLKSGAHDGVQQSTSGVIKDSCVFCGHRSVQWESG